MTRLELARPRDVSSLLGDAIAVYGRNALTFLGISAAVVVPVELIVSGIGLEQLTAPYDESPSAAETAIPTAVSFLVVAPLITATCIYALRDLGQGARPHAGRAITAGFEAFTPIFLAVVLMALGVALGLLLLIVPGIYVAVRWYFVPQVVVLEDARGPEALTASGRVVQGHWWRTFGVVILANLVAAVPGLLFIGPTTALASSADREVWSLVGGMAAEIVTAPFVALVSTLLYFDLRARSG